MKTSCRSAVDVSNRTRPICRAAGQTPAGNDSRAKWRSQNYPYRKTMAKFQIIFLVQKWETERDLRNTQRVVTFHPSMCKGIMEVPKPNYKLNHIYLATFFCRQHPYPHPISIVSPYFTSGVCLSHSCINKPQLFWQHFQLYCRLRMSD